jgi:hypothetical protein
VILPKEYHPGIIREYFTDEEKEMLMIGTRQMRCIAFEGFRRVAFGPLQDVAQKTKEAIEQGGTEPLLIFDESTSEQVEVDFRGSVEEVLRRLPEDAPTAEGFDVGAAPEKPRGPGRPKLGVVAREVTLLPRHWEWLADQPGGASVALRKLVEEARRTHEGKDRRRKAQESAYRFLSALAGNLPNFEEATRALFAGDAARFAHQIDAWPVDVREHALKLAQAACQPSM